jgi:hypothetical protein
MARLTVGVSLGCITSISALFVLTRAFGAERLSPWLETAYFAVFFGSVLWAFARPLPRAAVELCASAALVTAGIAVADAVVLGVPGASALTLAFDATALVAAGAMATLARAAHRRAGQAPIHSVWALPQPA